MRAANILIFIFSFSTCVLASGAEVARAQIFDESFSEKYSDSVSGATSEAGSGGSSEAASQTRGYWPSSNGGFHRAGLDVGYVYGYFRYSEADVRDSGSLNGIRIRYDARFEAPRMLLRGETEYILGRLQYDGTLRNIDSGESEPHSAEAYDAILNVRGLLGGTIEFSGRQEVTPYTGAGARHLSDRVTGVGSYEREVTYYYVPVGVEHLLRLRNGWRLTTALEYDVFIAGRVKSRVADVGFSNDPVTSQKQGYGHRIALSFGGAVNHRYDLHVGPYWQHWTIGDSDTVAASDDRTPIMESRNRSDLVGVNVTFGI